MSQQISYSQIGLLKLVERVIRSHPLLYLVCRYLVRYTNIFEADANGIKFIKFNKSKINLIDIGASDGISINFFKKNLNVNKCFCFEPNKNFIKILKKKKFKNTKIYDYGLGKSGIKKIYVPCYKIFGHNFYLNTYAFYNKNELKKQIKLDFFLKSKIPIKETYIKIKKAPIIKNKIDLIKIDVNGNEYEIILNINKLINKNKPALIVENSKSIAKITRHLKKKNYGIFYFCNKKKLFLSKKNDKALNYYFLQNKHIN